MPLAPQPSEQVVLLLDQSGAHLIVTDGAHFSLACRLAGTRKVLNIDEITEDPPLDSPKVQITSDCLAHILFTSGSTGPAKGVVHSH